MKLRRLVKMLAAMLDAGRIRQRREIRSVRGVLSMLRAKERTLQQRQAAAGNGEERDEISGKLDVLHAQRLKGVTRLQEIRSGLRAPGRSRGPRNE